MLLVESAGDGLETLALYLEARCPNRMHDFLQFLSAGLGIDGAPEACELCRRVGVAAPADEEAIRADLEIVADAFRSGCKCALGRLVGRFVQGKPDVPVGPEELRR